MAEVFFSRITQKEETSASREPFYWNLPSVFYVVIFTLYTVFQNGRHLDILLFLLKLDLDASFKAKYSFEF